MATIGPSRPLEFAENVLKRKTLYQVNRDPRLNRCGRAILDRWAFNQPKALKELERQGGSRAVLTKILAQQEIEQEIMERNKHQLANGLVPHEVLQMNEIETRLISPVTGNYEDEYDEEDDDDDPAIQRLNEACQRFMDIQKILSGLDCTEEDSENGLDVFRKDGP